jgi:probable F420-dependent oxidoreductase
MKFGLDLQRCNPRLWVDLAQNAESLGFESLWLAEHLIFPRQIATGPGDDHVKVDSALPLFDPFVVLATLGAKTEKIRLGTNVYNIGLRHPFVTARAVATADLMTEGRITHGIGASWLRQEWEAVGLDFDSRGARVDEAIDVCRALWSEEFVEHHGRFFDFAPVVFNPKPAQDRLPIHIGGDSVRALRRVVERGDGWIGMLQSVESFTQATTWLERACDAAGRSYRDVQRTALVRHPDAEELAQWQKAGATRLIVSPWRKSTDAVASLHEFARLVERWTGETDD